jgi:hypothetical protein
MKKEEVLQKIRNLFPEAESMSIDYYGDGDDFGEFSDLTVWGKEVVIEKYTTSEYESKFISLTENYIFTLFDSAANTPTFIDAGSNGNVYFDLLENKVTLSNTYRDHEYEEECETCDGMGSNDDGDECKDCDGTGGGDINWDADDIEDICNPEVF